MLQRLGGFLQPVHTTSRVGFGVLSVKPGCRSPGSIRNYLVYLPPAYRVKKTGGMVRQVSKVKVANPQGRNSGRLRRPIDMR
jgi:hypothetical protein